MYLDSSAAIRSNNAILPVYSPFKCCSYLPTKKILWKKKRNAESSKIINHCVCVCVCVCEHAQSCLALCDPMDCNLLGSSVRGIFSARIQERVAFPHPGNLPNPVIKPVSPESPALAGRFFTTESPRNLNKY